MQDPIEILMREHRTIETVLDALDVYAEALAEGAGPERRDLGQFVTFIREFADRKHHGKEEAILFDAMASHGFPREAGPVAVMLREHDIGRGHVGAMAEVASSEDAWTDGERKRARDEARSFTGLLRQHIQKEDTILYPMAKAQLPPEAMVQVAERCARFEGEQAESGVHARLEGLAKELVERYGSQGGTHR